MSSRGYGHAYYILKALGGFQSKLDIAYGRLLENTMLDSVSIVPITDDFTAPDSFSSLGGASALFSTALFLVGGTAGIMGVGMSFAGVTATAAVGVAEGLMEKSKVSSQYKDAEKRKKAAENLRDNTDRLHRGSGALGGATFIAGTVFNTIAANSDEYGKVDDVDMSNLLIKLFENARQEMNDTARLAVGDPRSSQEWATLPHQAGSRDLVHNHPIAGFFADGKWLVGDQNTAFEGQLDATFGLFSKI